MSKCPFYTKMNVPPKRGIKFKLPSMTQQHEKYETDIHNILLKHSTPEALAMYGNGRAQKAFYGDFSEMPSFDQVMQMQARATEYFEGLPSNIRAQFHNDSSKFIKFIGNPENHEQAVKLGLLEKLPEKVTEVIEKTKDVVKEPTDDDVKQTTPEGGAS